MAEELVSREEAEVTLYLTRKSPVATNLPRCRVVTLQVSGFARRLRWENVRSARELVLATRECRRDMRRQAPQVTVGFGGYASVPGALAARSLRVPLVLHEQNVVPGSANRLLAPLARAITISFADTLDVCPGWRRKAVVTGNPLLKREGEEEDPYRYFGLDERRKTLAVVGGSQGAASLNRAVLEALPAWSGRRDLQVLHAVGKDKYQDFMAEAAKVDYGGLIYRPVDFVERMDLLYQAADLVVCRAGAATVAELAAAGRGAILVPYPHATAAHQDANAEVLRRCGAAVVVHDRELDGRRLREEAERLLEDEAKLRKMGEAARREARPQAAAQLAEIVLALAREGK